MISSDNSSLSPLSIATQKNKLAYLKNNCEEVLSTINGTGSLNCMMGCIIRDVFEICGEKNFSNHFLKSKYFEDLMLIQITSYQISIIYNNIEYYYSFKNNKNKINSQ